ncbi:hypothetical protein FOTG_17411 [Fusarium oxysporum f. sp. vasinfectum 25433]|uniref:Wax synthase domain-containing protein n=2 Tax=Fusarium oxysporum TaxID=5507 RepID=X0M0F2_FUSOX|nr:hypothetical protein FOTG_17411 [Fusarium oxysporum f. sp. vasinfectum 25433]
MLALVISLLGIELLLTSTAVAFSNEDSLIRLGFLPLMGIATYKIMIICANGQLESPIAHAVLGSGSVYRIIHYVAIVLLDRWSFEAKGPTSSLGGLEPASDMAREDLEFSWSLKDLEERIRFGIRVSTTTRFSTTKWSIKYVPQFDDNKPGLVPARLEFLWRTFIRVGSLGCCLGLLGTFAQNFWKHNASMFSQEYVPVYSRLQEVTLAELSIRIAGVLSYWVMQYLSLSLMYGFLSFLAVLVHLSDVEEWPPVFGPINETWSIARFWGRFYHQNIRRGCSSIAHFLTYSCLRLTTGGFFSRYDTWNIEGREQSNNFFSDATAWYAV